MPSSTETKTKKKIIELQILIEGLKANYEVYKKEQIEEDTRDEFIDKFFKLLGWNMSNNEHLTPNSREVKRNDKRYVKGRQKYPDYTFRVNKNVKFFVEAKRISVDILKNPLPALQLRRYGHSADLPLCILTDFEEFAIYDTKVKVRKTDNARTARKFYCTYKQLLIPYEGDNSITNFEYIYSIFSKESVINKSLDNIKTQKGNQPLDKEFLEMIDGWRLHLANNIAGNNPKINIPQLNYAVQKLIDRIIFLRIAEDKDIEDYETLLKLSEKTDIYSGMLALFNGAQNKYNSELFASEDWLCDLKIDDKTWLPIINKLYESYSFSVMPVEILGRIYEQFLGKVIRLTATNHVKIDL